MDFFIVQLLDYQGAIAGIYTLHGRLIREDPLTSENTEIITGGLAKGMYLVKVHTRNGVALRRFIKK